MPFGAIDESSPLAVNLRDIADEALAAQLEYVASILRGQTFLTPIDAGHEWKGPDRERVIFGKGVIAGAESAAKVVAALAKTLKEKR